MHFYYLALFICRLFGDGNFRTVHIVFKPNTFDYIFLDHIDSICPNSMPLYLTDITQPWVWPWNENDNPNNVLQLMFLDPKTFSKDTGQLKEFFTLYRIFAFPTTDIIDAKTRSSIPIGLRRFSGSNNLILKFDEKNVFVFNDFDDQYSKPVFTVNNSTDFSRHNIFDETFGQYERMLSISIKTFDSDESFRSIQRRISYDLNCQPNYYISNYFNLFLNKTYVDFIWLRLRNDEMVSKNFTLIPDHPKYYKEVSRTFKLIPNDDDNTT